MQNRVGLALSHFVQQLTDFRCGCRNNRDTASFRLREDFIHYWKRAMGAGPDKKPLASPRNVFFTRPCRVVPEGTIFVAVERRFPVRSGAGCALLPWRFPV